MSLEKFIMLIHEFLNKGPIIVPKEALMIILDSKYDVFMAKSFKYTKHKRHIARRMQFLSHGEKCNMQKIYWCEGGLQFADIYNKNVGENDLTPRIKCIMERLDN